MIWVLNLHFLACFAKVATGSLDSPKARLPRATGRNPLSAWKKSGSTYYECFHLKESYTTAIVNCRRYGGRLAAKVLRDPKAVSNIITLSCIGKARSNHPWIGFHEEGVAKNWTWSDGGSINNATTEWATGKPNNRGGNDGCAMITSWSGNKILLNGSDCSIKTTYICEVEVPCYKEQRINGFTFPKTRGSSTSYSKELCPGSNTPMSSIYCASEGLYDLDSIGISGCQSIESVLNQTFTDTTLQSMQLVTANGSALTSDNAVTVSNYLTKVSDLNTTFSKREVGEVAEITSNLGDFYQQHAASDFASEKQELVKSLSKISRKLQSIPSKNSSFSTASKDVHIEIMDVTITDEAYSFNASFYRDNKSVDTSFVPMTVTLPAEAVDVAKRQMSSSSVRVVSVRFRSSSLFPSSKTAGWVISASLGNATDSIEEMTLIKDSVVITNNDIVMPEMTKINDFKNEVTKLECVYWDFTIEDWSGKGCTLLRTSPATCQCDHLTNFAILVSRSVIPADFTLDVMAIVGCALSIIGHILTLLVIGLSKKLRGRYQMRILANICFCLLIALSLFLFGVDALEPKEGCIAITISMHLFFLSAWFWTAIYGYTIYRDIAQTMASYGKSFKFKLAAPFAYGTPFLIVLFNATIALGVIDRDRSESSYRAQNFCWLHHNSLYFGFLLVIGILFLFNLWVFSNIIPKVTCKRTKTPSSIEKHGIEKHVVTIVILVTTMGLTWIFGFVMLVSDNPTYLLTMSWLFTIVIAFQGMFIFYFTAVRSGELVRLCDQHRRRSYSPPTSIEKSQNF